MKEKLVTTLKICCAVCALLCWWGVLYPQFTLLEGTYCVTQKQGVPEAEKLQEDPYALYRDMMEADGEHIQIKSRLLENWRARNTGRKSDS